MRPQAFQTPITDLLNIRHPLLCGGLGPGVSDGRYVAAAVNAGGMGFIVSSGYDSIDQFETELRLCEELTGGKPFGVNLYISRLAGGYERVRDMLPLLSRYRVSCVETAGASPEELIPALKARGIKVLHKVPAVRYVATAERVGADAVIVVGAECGGHPGTYLIGSIVQVARAPEITSLPVIAAGGFGTGRQLVAALAMGAGAILMGSRMMAAEELWVHDDHKRRVVAGDGTESRIIKQTLRDHHRVLFNDSARSVLALEAANVTDFDQYRPHVNGDLTRAAYRSGDTSMGMIDWGPAVVFAEAIMPVEEIFDAIIDDALAAVERVGRLRRPGTWQAAASAYAD